MAKINNEQIWSNSGNQSLKSVDHFKFYIMGNYLSYLDSQQYPDFCGLLVLPAFEIHFKVKYKKKSTNWNLGYSEYIVITFCIACITTYKFLEDL